MVEASRLVGLLEAIAAQMANDDKLVDYSDSLPTPTSEVAEVTAFPYSLPSSLLEALSYADKNGVPVPPLNQPLSAEFKPGLRRLLNLVHTHIIRDTPFSNPPPIIEPTTSDLTNALDLAIPRMAGRFPVLNTSDLPDASPQEQAATASPARGHAMLNSIFKSVRVPEFRHKWMFWAEKGQQSAPKDNPVKAEGYAMRPKPLGEQIISVKEFYQHFNNIPVESLKLRDSIHLFHVGVKPVWEDPRNVKGGAWYFKIGKDVAEQFWHEMCLLAVGDVLQGAVETKRIAFNDDICGITYSVRWNAVQVAVWTRDAENEAGKAKLLAVILDKLSPELQPKKEGSYWYKAHKEHAGFVEPGQAAQGQAAQ
ncbi:translation initiation factor eIF4e [Dothidotthia symphoricarpi CBS 119687]|uniref:Translation initiation factor eIF4e n=1 Tax=Dothidotthia symphoricarpi CBS 119687 TaxID=1392245 RepID=A0A6A6A777_9PLEO|nr:translation initiation factor eIF4e [Dothidotthia symphoricarpi CBS 119687]KAF2126657.1 translation initiation factor eIF4e [Dothidotthia symphoricarpi CBS 119687]